ncbi:MAG: hypothetical protein ACLUE1_06030, partial [Adlercreutzia equolifaciens]
MARHASPVQSLLVDDRFDGDVYAHEPLSRHTTYRIGGPARFFVRANSVGALTGLVDVCARPRARLGSCSAAAPMCS